MWVKLIELLVLAWATLALLRFLLQRGGMHVSHPLAQLCIPLTDPIVKPARRAVKAVRGWDMAIVAAVFFVLLLTQTLLATVPIFKGAGFGLSYALLIVGNSVLFLTQALAYALIICLIIQTVLSFSDPYNPLMRVVHTVLSPLTRPFARLRIGRIDFSGSVLFLLLWLWVGVVVPDLRHRLLTLLFFG
ncbi:MAG: YggT family protein [Neisseria sp.]|nr:YggT family protein [Neisseria sp.]